jgi:hypothetical protein
MATIPIAPSHEMRLLMEIRGINDDQILRLT